MASLSKRLIDLDKGLAERFIYSSEEVYKQELENVFGRCWLYVAHESQVRHFYDCWARLMEAPSWSKMTLDPITSAGKS